jgi:hypothetical protein
MEYSLFLNITGGSEYVLVTLEPHASSKPEKREEDVPWLL